MRTKKYYKIIAVMIMLSLIGALTLQVFAVTESDKTTLQNQINQAKNQLNEITDNKEEAESDLDNINDQISDVENELSDLKSQLEEKNDEISLKQDEISKEEKQIDEKNKLLQDRMVALYEAGDTSYLDVLLNSDDVIDFISGYSAIQTIAQADTDLINELESQKTQLEEDKSTLETAKQKIEDLKNEQEIKNATLLNLQSNKQSEINKLTEEQKTTQSAIEKYNASMVKVNEELAAKWKAAQEAMNKSNSSGGGSSSNTSTGNNGLNFDGSFIWPCNNKTVTSRMKYRWGRWHKGIDIAASYESVYAAASGYAFRAYDGDGYGNYIMIFHGSGYVTLYGHLSSIGISDGQYVKQGQTIATSGNTGDSTGAHLHFEIRQASSISDFFSKSPLNPLDYLPGGYTLASGA